MHNTPLPVDVKIPLGSRGTFAAEYYENGVKYVGKADYIAHEGSQTVNIVLLRPRPPTTNFCPYCKRSLKGFDKIGMKCPLCDRNL